MNYFDFTPRFVIAASLIFVFAVLAILNAILFVRRQLLHRPSSASLVPLISGVIGCYGFSLARYATVSSRAWLPFFLFG
jgi:hypothetical protein